MIQVNKSLFCRPCKYFLKQGSTVTDGKMLKLPTINTPPEFCFFITFAKWKFNALWFKCRSRVD
jgi:hypothetical protein